MRALGADEVCTLWMQLDEYLQKKEAYSSYSFLGPNRPSHVGSHPIASEFLGTLCSSLALCIGRATYLFYF